MHVYVRACEDGCQRITFWYQFSLSPVWVLGFKLGGKYLHPLSQLTDLDDRDVLSHFLCQVALWAFL